MAGAGELTKRGETGAVRKGDGRAGAACGLAPEAVRELAFRIARDGEDVACAGRSTAEVDAARDYLIRTASTDGRLALGKNLILVERALADALATGDVKNALAALRQQAEVLRLCDFANADSAAQTEATEREEIVRGYLESTGLFRRGLKLEELARLTAQYVVDRILPEETRIDAAEETKRTEENDDGDDGRDGTTSERDGER